VTSSSLVFDTFNSQHCCAFTVSHSITQFELRLACSLPLQKEEDNRMSVFSSLRSANVLAVAVTLSVTMHGQNVKAVKREIVDI
jgi:hypothetical protein